MPESAMPESSTLDADTMVEISDLRREVAKLNSHRFVRVHNSYWRMVVYQFIRGLAFGLGTVLGASLLASALVYSLSQIDFIPILGEWAAEIARMIQEKPQN